jgi:hypothetical protein
VPRHKKKSAQQKSPAPAAATTTQALAAADLALEHGRRLGQSAFVKKFEKWLSDYQRLLRDSPLLPVNPEQNTALPPASSPNFKKM